MSDDRFERLERIFGVAIDLADPARAQYLDEACGDDSDLRRSVDSLLAHGNTGGEFIRSAVESASPVAGYAPGQRIDNYVLEKELGRGGMGEVWLAKQTTPIRRLVALKLIKAGMDTREVIARFGAERQALALMDHEAVARVHDAGATAEGRPYFVMEHVDGLPITRFCDEQRLDLRRRLELFIRVCEGVQHAHQKAVLHRDLKPSNILVAVQDNRYLPKIIDFGVAKASGPRLTDQTFMTEHGLLIGTPEYMSPEQAGLTGQDVDTRTDVYSLGAVLYELLVGVRPLNADSLRTAGPEEIRRYIREEDPSRPSTRVESLGDSAGDSAGRRRTVPEGLRRQLRGELDWITMKALEKERDRRYESAAALADDVRRYLEHEPVVAGPPGRVYRMRKFVRRHRLAVTAVASLILFLTVLTVSVSLQSVRIARARDRADREKEKTQAINTFLLTTLGSANPVAGIGREVTLLDALDAAHDRVADSFADDPEIRAAVLSSIGNTYRKLGRLDRAESLLRESLALRRSVHGELHVEVVESLHDLAALLKYTGDLDEATRLLRQSLATRRILFGESHPRVGNAMLELGKTLRASGHYEESEQLLRESLAILRAELGELHESVADSMDSLAGTLQAQGNYEETESLQRDALAMRKQLFGTEHPDISDSLNNLGRLLLQLGRLEEAEPLLREVVELDRKLLGEQHHYTAGSTAGLAGVLQGLGRLDEAEELFRRSLAIRRNVLGPDNPEVAIGLTELGRLLIERGQYDAAEGSLLEAAAIREKSLAPSHPLVADSKAEMGWLRLAQGNPDEAAARFREALDAYAHSVSPEHPMTQIARSGLGIALLDLGRSAEAEVELSAATTSLAASLGEDAASTRRAREALASLRD